MANARSVNVKRVDLLAKLKENREKHAAEYKVAMEGYRIEVGNLLRLSLDNFNADKKIFDGGLTIIETPPEDHTGDYDQVVAMMEMSVDDIINLDSSSFQQFVLDNWAWKQNFAATTSKYMSNVR